jgi:hypothetical protein
MLQKVPLLVFGRSGSAFGTRHQVSKAMRQGRAGHAALRTGARIMCSHKRSTVHACTVQDVHDLLAAAPPQLVPSAPETLSLAAAQPTLAAQAELHHLMARYEDLSGVALEAQKFGAGLAVANGDAAGALIGGLPALLPGPLFVMKQPCPEKLYLAYLAAVRQHWQSDYGDGKSVGETLMQAVDQCDPHCVAISRVQHCCMQAAVCDTLRASMQL